MKKNRQLVTIIFFISFILFLFAQSASANQEIKDEIQKIEKQEKSLEKNQKALLKEQKEAEEKLRDNHKEQTKIEKELNDIYNQIQEIEHERKEKVLEIQTTEKEINSLAKEIEILQKEIEEVKMRIEKREKILNRRLRTIQKNGGTTQFVEVLFGSNSFSDFIGRSIAMNTIMEQDKALIEEQLTDQASLDRSSKKLENEFIHLEENKEKLEKETNELMKLEKSLEQKYREQEEYIEKVQSENQKLELHLITIQEEREIIDEQKKIIQGKKNQLKQLSDASSSGNALFVWPTKGVISSPYGNRSFNGGSFHYGLDIAAPKGTPIVAAASGVVTRATYSSSYGNVVYIYHEQFNKTTVYAHMNSISVKKGESVRVGDQIGTVGNTGYSFGNHLHFEVHNGVWKAKGGVDPLQYLK